MLQHIICN